MRPKRFQSTRVVPVLIASVFLAALVFPTINRAAEPLLVAIGVTPAAPKIFVDQHKQFTATLHFNDGSQQSATAPSGVWASTGSLSTPRYYHTATRLLDGTVLVVGGWNGSFTYSTAERYNPATGLWTSAGSMGFLRAAHTATLLPNGQVLVVGGANYPQGVLTNTTSLYDPGTNSWSTGPALLNGVRAFHAAVGLDSGDVLVTAGLRFAVDCTYRTQTEIYDWVNRSWKNADSLNLARSNATAMLLDDGKVLLAGGPANNCPTPNIGLDQAEIFDPAKNDWSVLPNLSTRRYNNFIAKLPNGRVLLAGGVNETGITASADVFTPTSTGGTFALTAPMAVARSASGGIGDNGVTIADGQVLVAGGQGAATVLSSAELFNPTTAAWSPTGSLLTARAHNTITSLGNGMALVVGGLTVGGVPLASAEVYQPDFVWASSNPSVATIDQTGQATALAPGTTTITVTSGSIVGSTTLTVEPKPLPTASFTANPNPSACGQTVMFNASLSHAAPGFSLTNYTWDFGDGATGTGATTTHAYAAFGTYVARLTVSDNNSPPYTDVETVLINVNQGNHAPIASHGGPYLVDLGSAASLDGTGSSDADTACGDSIVSYSWSINNGAITASGASPLLAAAQINLLGVGTFPLTLTVTDEFGQTGTASTTLSIYNNVPTAAFTAMPNPAACGQAIAFNGTLSSAGRPDRAIVSYQWNFGDNTTAVGATVTHAYAQFGTYNATLTVTDNNVPAQQATKTIPIAVSLGNHAPIANLGGPYTVDLGSSAFLDGTGSSDADTACGDSIVSYFWSINNGAITANGASLLLTAAQINALGVGAFPVSLTVTDEFGQIGTASTTLSIYNNVPTAAFNAMPNPAACGQAITFNGTLSSAGRPDRAIVSYQWNFGDNTTATGATVTHAYQAFGTYSATLTVTDNNVPAQQATTTIPIAVNQGNLAPFANAGGPYSVNAGASVQLNGALSSDPNAGCGDQIVSYEWNIGGIQLSGPMPTLNTATTPLSPGNHNVSLTVRDSFGLIGSASTTITVQRVLVSIAVTPTPVTLQSGQQQMFTATGTFSDGSTETLMSSGGGGPVPPSFGPNDPAWQVQFPQMANFSACSTPQYPNIGSFSSQNLLTRNGQVDMLWSAGTPVIQVQGTVTLTDVVLKLACTNGAAFGTIDATWTGTRYEGRLFFNNGASQSDVTITGWSSQAPMPMARFGLTALAHGGKVHAIGGTAGACGLQNPCPFAPTTTVQTYDPADDSWSLGPSLNHGREGGRAIVLGNKWYVIGGHTPGGQSSGIVEELDPSGSNTWSVLASDPMPTARANFALVTDGTYLYVIGGDTTIGNGGPVATVERFNPMAPEGQRWTPLASMPVAGNFIGAGVLNGTIVVVGAGGSSRTDLYDVAGNAWSQGVPMPAQRTAMASAVANGGLWLIGGTTNGALNYDTWVYYPATPTRPAGWAGVGSMLTGRTTPAAAVIGDVIYAPGGADASNSALATNEALSTPPFEDLSTSGGSPGGGGSTTPTVQWQSTNSFAATVDGMGRATAKSAGQTQIVATAGNISCETTQSCAMLIVTNTVPAVQIFGGPFTTNESANFQNFSTGGNFTDPDQQSWTATVNYGDGTGTQPLMLSNLQNGFTPTGQFNLSHQYVDSGVFTVTVTVDDHAGGIGVVARQVTVNNVAPQVSGPQSSSTNVGSSMSFGCISFFDVPADAPFTAFVNYGDGSGDQSVTPNVPGSCGGGGTPTGAFNLSHVYSTGGNFTVTARVTDKDGATGMRSFPISVNAAPAVTIDNTPLAPINEGGTFSGTASFTDAMGDGPWTVRINYGDNTGQSQSSVSNLGSIPLSHMYRDNGSYVISVQVQDKFFLSGNASATLTVNNVAPTVNTLPMLNAITEGQQINFNVGYSDPGLNDNQSGGFTAQINWGDGSALQTMSVPFNNGNGTFFLNHTYRDNPAAPDTAFTISVTVKDKDGAMSAAKTTQLVVNNAPPAVQLNNFSDLVEGVPVTFSGQLFDQGALDAPWSGEVDFGDGVVQPFTFMLNQQGQSPRGTFSVTHTYQQAGPVTLTLRATDKDGAIGTNTFQLDVNPVMVSVAVSPVSAWLNAVGKTLLFNGSAQFSDGSTHHTNGNEIPGVMWSSSNPAVATVAANGLATAMGPGVTTITLNVEDDLGHHFTAQATLRVDVTAPVITANDITAQATSSGGAQVTLVFSATDDFDSNPTVTADHNSGVFPIGTTDVIVTATDAAGNTSTKTMKVTVVNATPPSITVPASITVDATSPQGALVSYAASATDALGNNIAVICIPPPGMFPIGSTTVTCTATDAANNTATASFTVLVQAAAAQVSQLMDTVQAFNLQQGIANSLDAKLGIILAALNDATSGNTTSVCNQLGAFINETSAQSGKKLTVAQANQLIAAAQQIRAVIGCQ